MLGDDMLLCVMPEGVVSQLLGCGGEDVYSSFERPRPPKLGGGVCWDEEYPRSMFCKGDAFGMYCCRLEGGVDMPLYLDATGDWTGVRCWITGALWLCIGGGGGPWSSSSS